MRSDDIMNALSGIDPKYIDEAAFELHEAPAKKGKVVSFRSGKAIFAAVSAAALILLTFTVTIPLVLRMNKSESASSAAYEAPAAAESAAEYAAEEAAADSDAVYDAKGAENAAEEAAAPEAAMDAADTEESEVGMINPWRDITEEEAGRMVPNLFKVPDGATNVRWSAMGGEDPDDTSVPGPMVQVDYDLDGLTFTERAQITGDDYEDISGMYYDWTVSDDVELANWGEGHMQGKTYRYIGEDEMADLITWYDVEIGISYSLATVSSNLDGFDIQAVAEASYDPAKQAWASIPD